MEHVSNKPDQQRHSMPLSTVVRNISEEHQPGILAHPSYSPAFNPAEYLIHLVRQDALYHLPCTFTLQDKAERVKRHLAQGPPLTPKQMGNLLRHIGNLPRSGKTVKSWPKLE
jgi:hypothetical protein